MREALLARGLDADAVRAIAERHGWRPVATVLAAPRTPPARRRLLEAALLERASRLPDGEAIALCRIATETVLRALVARRSSRVLAAALAAPRATAAVAQIVRERRDLSLDERRALLAASRFAGPSEPTADRGDA